jgi:hypothetical protein
MYGKFEKELTVKRNRAASLYLQYVVGHPDMPVLSGGSSYSIPTAESYGVSE